MKKKLLIIGLDGVPWRILDKMIEENVTPNLKKLKEKGAYGELETTIPPLTPAAWSSIQTGVNPGKHGVFSFQGPRKGGGPPAPVNSKDIQTTTFPEFLDNAGLRAVLVNLPLSHPPKTDFPTVGSIFSNEIAKPESLLKEYDFSYYELSAPDMTETNVKKNLKNIHSNVKSNFPVVKKLYQNEDWDLFFYMFSQTDWTLHQAGEEFFFDEDEKKVKLVKRIYKAIDEKIGWFIDQMDKKTNLLIMSDHGFKNYEKQLSPANRLEKENLIKVQPKSLSWESENSLRDNLLSNTFRLALHSKTISSYLEFRYPWFCNNNMTQIKEESKVLAGDPKFPAFFINDERFFGTVKDKHKVKKKLDEVLNTYSDKIEVHKKDDIYWGDQLERGPEYIAMPKKYLPKMFLINREITTGEFQHSMDGIVIGYGPDVKHTELEGSTVFDITPTILHYFDIPLPEYLDGNVLMGMLEEASDLYREPEISEKKEEKKIKDKIKEIDL
ncbi:MAG: alkaline phosphatase family protein [Candidatus Thermoplasmatota archaeon]